MGLKSSLANNQKYLILSGVALSTVGIASYLLKDQPKRAKMKLFAKDVKSKILPYVSKTKKLQREFPVAKGGNPDPQDIEDNKMVSEGAQYSVQYYNQTQQ
ncbi:hypothetical protein GJU40_17405 [Bacillus lacus]|uniref:YtxH domain-containing protein n=1 Tax=Metabacillus lacus TaxID=1983721 RepID=A0A7X2J200_9BACI|nr:hypothetical protein [Metabacillus lacus]MRX73915.1 hypothetical protein [Metabacillus lacus]